MSSSSNNASGVSNSEQHSYIDSKTSNGQLKSFSEYTYDSSSFNAKTLDKLREFHQFFDKYHKDATGRIELLQSLLIQTQNELTKTS